MSAEVAGILILGAAAALSIAVGCATHRAERRREAKFLRSLIWPEDGSPITRKDRTS